MVLSITGCSSRTSNQDKLGITSTQAPEDNNEKRISNETNNQVALSDQDSSSEITIASEESETITIAPAATKEISIYTMNDATFEVESTVALIPQDSEITPELIVDLVVDSLADRLVEVGIEEVIVNNDTVIVSFQSDQPPLVNVGGGIEGTILDAIAQSIVDNIDYSPKVIFRVEGEAYASGHFEFDIDEVYLDGSKTN
jgi:hypothetical protein